MGNILSGSEVVAIGIQIEQNGKDFYYALVKQSKNPKAQEVFEYLGREEEIHIKAFQAILDTTEKYEPLGSDADKYYDYMNGLASDYVFTQKNKGLELAKIIKTDKEAINAGIGFEKESIIFYAGIKKVVPPYDQKIVDELISQEQDHLRQLFELRKNVIL